MTTHMATTLLLTAAADVSDALDQIEREAPERVYVETRGEVLSAYRRLGPADLEGCVHVDTDGFAGSAATVTSALRMILEDL